MNSLVAGVLNRLLGAWVQDLDASSLQLSVLRGKVELGPVQIKTDAVENLGLPLRLKQGWIERVVVAIPWTALTSSPWVVEIAGLHVVLATKEEAGLMDRKRELLFFHESKQRALDQFELLPATEVSSQPGFAMRMVTRIVDNLQLTVRDLSVSVEYGEKQWTLEAGLGALTVLTCNSQWNPEYVSGATVINKVVNVEDVRVAWTREEALPILHPLDLMIKLELNRDEPEAPRFKADIELGEAKKPVQLSLHAGFLTSAQTLSLYLTNYREFRVGVLSREKQRDLTAEDIETYHQLYRNWKNNSEAESALKDFEKDKSLSDLLSQRKVLRSRKSLSDLIVQKQTLLEATRHPQAGAIGWVKGWFVTQRPSETPSKEEESLRREIEELTKKQDSVQVELEGLLGDDAGSQDNQGVEISFGMEKFELTLYRASAPALLLSISGLRSTLSHSPELLRLTLDHKEISVQQFLSPRSAFPYIALFKNLRSLYSSTKEKQLVDYRAKNSYFVYDVEIVKYMVETVNGLAPKEMDVEFISERVSAKTVKYIKLGRLSSSSISSGQTSKLSVLVKAQAPRVYLPLSTTGQCLVWDLGYVSVATDPASSADRFQLSLKTTSLELWSQALSPTEFRSKAHIIIPFSISASIVKSSASDSLFTLQSDIQLDPISVQISDEFLRFGFALKEQMQGVWAGLTPGESIAEAVQTTAYEIRQNLKVAMKERKSANPIDVKVRLEKVEIGLIKEGTVFRDTVLQGVYTGLTIAADANMLASFHLRSLSISDPQSTHWPLILSASPLTPSSTVPLPMPPALLSAEMLQEHLRLGEDSGLLDLRYAFRAEGNETKIWVQTQPISISPNAESFLRLKDFIVSCQPEAASGEAAVQAVLHAPTPVPSEAKLVKARESVETFSSSSSFSIKLDIGTIKLNIPESVEAERARVLGVELELGVSYAYVYSEDLHFDEQGLMFRRELKERKDEADVNIFKLKAYFGHSTATSDSLDNSHELLHPMRASTRYSYEIRQEDALHFDLDIEVLEAAISFRDIVSLQRILRSFQSLGGAGKAEGGAVVRSTKEVLYDVDVRVETMICGLVDDFSQVATPVLKCVSSNITFSLTYSRTLIHLESCGALEIRYFNTSMVEWELLLEEIFWRVYVLEPVDMLESEQGIPMPVAAIEFEVSRVAKVNLSLRMLESIAEVMKSLQLLAAASSSSDKSKELDQIAEMTPQQWYMFQNKLGEPIQVLLCNTTIRSHLLTLSTDTEHVMSKVQIEKLLLLEENRVQRRFGGHYYELVLPTTLALKVNGDTIIEGVSIDGNDMHRFTMIAGDYIYGGVIHKHNKGQVQVIAFESLLRVVNQTDVSLKISANDREDTRELSAGYSLAAPLRWTEPSQTLYVGKDLPTVELSLLDTVKIDTDFNLVVDEIDLEVQNSLEVLQVLILSAPLSLQNSLPYTVTGASDGLQVSCAPGATVREMRMGLEGRRWKWTLEEIKAETPEVPMGDGEHIYKLSGNMSADKITLTCEKNVFSSCMDFDVSSYTQVRSHYNSRLCILYAPYLLINNTHYTLDFKAERTFVQVKAKDSGFAVVSKPTFKVRLSGDVFGSTSSYSEKFNGSTTGLTGCLKASHKHKIMPDAPDSVSLGVTIEQAPWPLHLSKVIRVYPRFFLYNLSDADLVVRQEGTERMLEVGKGGRLPFHFPSDSTQLLRLSEDCRFWSSAFSLDDIDSFQVSVRSVAPVTCSSEVPAAYTLSELGLDPMCLQPTLPYLQRYLDVFVTTSNGAVIYLIIKNAQFPSVVIQNQTEELLEIWQAKGQQRMTVFPLSSVPFAFEDLSDAKMMVTLSTAGDRMNMSLSKKKVSKRKLAGFEVSVSVNKTTKLLKVAVDPKAKTRKRNYYPPQTNPPSRSLSLSSQLPFRHFANFSFKLYFGGVEISLIDGTPAELLVLTIHSIDVKAHRETKESEYREYEYDLHLTIETLQVDNMSTGETEYPVLLCQTNSEQHICVLDLITRSTFSRVEDREVLVSFQVKKLILGLQEMLLQVHQDTLLRLMDVIGTIQSLFAYRTLARSDTMYLEAARSALESILRTEMPGVELGEELSTKVFFEKVELKSIKLTISYRTVSKKKHIILSKENSNVMQILGKVASAIVNISNSPLFFSTIILKKSFKSYQELVHSILSNYIRQGAVQFFNLLGASELLGNPIGLVRKLGAGVYELFEEPMKGLQKRNLKAFARGLGRGVRSLASSAVSGSLDSVSQVTGSLYRIVSQDQSASRTGRFTTEFQGSMESFASSIAGIVNKPMEGAKSGVGGFVKGVGAGLYGAATAPISLVLRVSSNVTSNIADAASFSALTPLGRLRFPRYFGPKKRLLPYRREIAQAQQYLRSSGYPLETALFCIELTLDKAVLITNSRIVVLHSGQRRTDVDLADIVRVEVRRDAGQFVFLAITKKEKLKVMSTRFADMGQLYEVVSALREAAWRETS